MPDFIDKIRFLDANQKRTFFLWMIGLTIASTFYGVDKYVYPLFSVEVLGQLTILHFISAFAALGLWRIYKRKLG